MPRKNLKFYPYSLNTIVFRPNISIYLLMRLMSKHQKIMFSI